MTLVGDPCIDLANEINCCGTSLTGCLKEIVCRHKFLEIRKVNHHYQL